MLRLHIKSIPLVAVLTFVLVSIVVTTLLISDFISYKATRQSLEEEAMSALALAADSTRDQIRGVVGQRRDRLTALLHSLELGCDISGTMNAICARGTMATFLREQRARGALLTYRKKGRLEVGIRDLPPDLAPGEVVFRKDPGGALDFVLTVSDKESGLSLTAAFPADSLPAYVQGTHGTTLVFADVNGDTLPIDNVPGWNAGPADRLAACTAGADSADFRAPAAIARVLRHVPRMPVCVAAQISHAQVLGPAHRLREKLKTLGFTFAAVAVAAAYLLALLLTWPIARLRAAIGAVKASRSDVEVPIVGIGEVRGLSEAFAALLHSLQSSRRALLESQERLTFAYRAAKLWVWEHHLDRGVVMWQQPARPGVPQQEMRFRSLLRNVHPDDRSEVCSCLRQALESGSFEAEYRVRTRAGRYIWIHAWGQMMRTTGNSERTLMGVSRDVTASRNNAELQREKDRLAATAEMSGALAHEINNPLTAVLGALYLAVRRSGLDPELTELLRVAHEEGERVANISRQLLALYRPVDNVSRVNVATILGDIVREHATRTHSKRQRVVAEISTPLTVDGYPDELRHALANVFVNALEVTPEGGTIRVRARMGMSWTMGKPCVKVAVADNGPGISPSNSQRIWNAFAGTKPERGTGLGLWVTRNVVLKHGGYLRLRSSCTVPTGTCVSIYVPLRQ